MIDSIKNEVLEIKVKRLGAELTSVKKNNDLEFLWQGDEHFWGGQSYNLFPLIGGVPNFDKKEGLQKLSPKESFDCEYNIILENK